MDFSLALRALVAIIPVYLIIALGFALRGKGMIKSEADSSFMRFSIDVAIPCFILFNLLGNEKLSNLPFALSTIAMGFIGMGGSLLIAWLAAKALGLKIGDGQRTFAVTTGANNYGFYIISLVMLLYPQNRELIGVIITHNVGCDIVYWSIGFLLISQTGGFSIKMFLKGPIIAVAIGLALVWTGFADHVPAFVRNTLQIIGNCAIPLNLILFGCMLNDFWGFKGFNLKIISSAVFIRMLFLPAIFLSAAYFLPLDPLLKMLLVLQASVPCGVTSAVLAKHFAGHPMMSVQITIVTSLIAIVTLPLYLAFGLKLIGF